MLVYLAFFGIVSLVLAVSGWWLYRELSISPGMTMSLVLMYSLVSKQVSLLYIEMVPSFLPEQLMVSSYTGASYRIFMMHLVFLIAVIGTCRLLNHYLPLKDFAERFLFESPPSTLSLDLSLLLTIGLILVQFVNIYLSQGFAGLSGDFSRYDFWEDAARFPILASIFGKTMAFVPPLLAILVWTYGLGNHRYRQALALSLLLPYWVFLYATGHRFTMTILNLGLFLSTYMLIRVLQSKSPISGRFAVASIVVLFVAVAVGTFDLVNRHFARNASGAVDAFMERAFVIQGATLWAVDDAVVNGRLRGNTSQLIDGMSAIRDAVLDPVNAEAYAEKGVNLSAGLPAICQLIFGTVRGSFVILIFGVFFALIYHLVCASIARGNLLGICCASMILSWSNSVYGAASIRLLLDWKYAVCLSITLIILMLPRLQTLQIRK